MVGQSKNSNNYWYRQQVVDAIHERYSANNGQNIFLPEIVTNNDVNLLSSAITLFGTWRSAVNKAGFGSDLDMNPQQAIGDYWSQENTIVQIKTLHQHGFDLSRCFIRHAYPELYSAAMNKLNFGSWSNALSEAEIEYQYLNSQTHRFWTLQRVFRAIHDYNQTYGNIQGEFIRWMNPSLYSNSRRYFRTWSEAAQSIGLNLNRNLVKVMLEPLRTSILMDYVKKILELLGTEYNLPELDSQDLPEYYLELDDGKTTNCITSAYRSWGFDSDRRVYELLNRYPRVTCYYSIGEPRHWAFDNVKFINIDEFNPDLIDRGRDDIISDLRLQARGGIPAQFQDQYNRVIQSIKETIRKNKKA